jgi:hypothetical protein
VLDNAAPQRDPSENARDGRRVVASVQIRPEQGRLARRMDPTGAADVGRDMFDEAADGDEVGPSRPVSVVDHRCEPQSTRRLLHAPDAPALGVVDDA